MMENIILFSYHAQRILGPFHLDNFFLLCLALPWGMKPEEKKYIPDITYEEVCQLTFGDKFIFNSSL